jgi:hypothetical protein
MSAIDVVERSQLTERPRMKSGDTVQSAREDQEGDKGACRCSRAP